MEFSVQTTNPAKAETACLVLPVYKGSDLLPSVAKLDDASERLIGQLLERGDFDAAIDGYQAVLDRAPLLTSLHLQIGHAYREKEDVERALEAYRAVPVDQPSGEEAQAAIAALEAGATRR